MAIPEARPANLCRLGCQSCCSGRLCCRPAFHFVFVSPTAKHIAQLVDCLGRGTMHPVIDRVFPLEALAQAHDYVECGHSAGKVVVLGVGQSVAGVIVPEAWRAVAEGAG
jgi:hypothetical protein